MKKVFSIIGILVSIAAIVIGITLADKSVFSYVMDAEFGADFYTYIYSATRTSAVRIAENTMAVYKSFGYLLIAVGALSLCGFGCNLGKEKTPVIKVETKNPSEKYPDPLKNISNTSIHENPDL